MTEYEQVKALIQHLEYFENKLRKQKMVDKVRQADIIILTGLPILEYLENKKRLNKEAREMTNAYKFWIKHFLNTLTFKNYVKS